MSSNRKRFLCLDCKVDTGKIGEHYMLEDSTWDLVHNSNKGMLCVGCLESRLGRQLVKDDFNNSYVNRPRTSGLVSQRLAMRLALGIEGSR